MLPCALVIVPHPLSRLNLAWIIFSLPSSGEERSLWVKTLKMFNNALKYSRYMEFTWSIERSIYQNVSRGLKTTWKFWIARSKQQNVYNVCVQNYGYVLVRLPALNINIHFCSSWIIHVFALLNISSGNNMTSENDI